MSHSDLIAAKAVEGCVGGGGGAGMKCGGGAGCKGGAGGCVGGGEQCGGVDGRG
jgi:hypothetical protein